LDDVVVNETVESGDENLSGTLSTATGGPPPIRPQFVDEPGIHGGFRFLAQDCLEYKNRRCQTSGDMPAQLPGAGKGCVALLTTIRLTRLDRGLNHR
jgi:hypothetical protein